jgi:hypothetical protein
MTPVEVGRARFRGGGINLKAAKAFGQRLPKSWLLRVDERAP